MAATTETLPAEADGSTPEASTPEPQPEASPPATKLFLGNLASSITEQSLEKHFSSFGKIGEVAVKNKGGQISFAFLTVPDKEVAKVIMSEDHIIDGITITRPVRARGRTIIPGPGGSAEKNPGSTHPVGPCMKVFVGGIPHEVTAEEFNEFCETFGKIADSVIMMDHVTGRPRGFGFVTFAEQSAIDSILRHKYAVTPLRVLSHLWASAVTLASRACVYVGSTPSRGARWR